MATRRGGRVKVLSPMKTRLSSCPAEVSPRPTSAWAGGNWNDKGRWWPDVV